MNTDFKAINDLKRDAIISKCAPKDEHWETLAGEVYRIQEQRKFYQMLEEQLVAKLKVASEYRPSYGKNFAYCVETRAGSVDYVVIPELRGVDLNQYRKPSVEVWKLINLAKV